MQRKLTYKRISTTGIPLQTKAGRYVVVKNDMCGMTDLLIFLKNGITLHVEVKSKTGKQSEEQKKWQLELKLLGLDTYFIVRSREDLEEILKRHEVEV